MWYLNNSAGSSPRGGNSETPGGSQVISRTQELLGRYPYAPFANPFFDIAGTYLPNTVKELFEYCRYYYMTHSIVNSIITRAAEYPLTPIIFTKDEKNLGNQWDDLLLDTMDYPTIQRGINLDYLVYGNAFVSLRFPFNKILKCKSCGKRHLAKRETESWTYTSGGFQLRCSCGHRGQAEEIDEYVQDTRRIRIIRWEPRNMTLVYNESTGETTYSMSLSETLVGRIKLGHKPTVAGTPTLFLKAAEKGKNILYTDRQVFHMKRPGASGLGGWGIPMILPVLKDAFYMSILKKAQEQVMMHHLLPREFVFPQASSGAADPPITVDLSKWQGHLAKELNRMRQDPAYTGQVPFPVGYLQLGGQGRSMLLAPEIDQLGRNIAVGMGFPISLVYGDGSYAGTSVNMKMLEKFFSTNIQAQSRLLRWVMKQISGFLKWSTVSYTFKPFRMADDAQRQALLIQLSQMGKVSDTTVLGSIDLDVKNEDDAMVAESKGRGEAMMALQKNQAAIESEIGIVSAKGQAKAQQAMMEAQQAEADPDPFMQALESDVVKGNNPSMKDAILHLVDAVKNMPPDQRNHWLGQILLKSPELHQTLGEYDPSLMQSQEEGVGGQSPNVDMRPMPEQLPPRRE